MCTRRLVGRMCTVNATHGTRYAVNTLTHTQWTCTIFNNMKINMLFTVLFSMKRKGMPKALLYMQVHVCVCVSWVCVCEGVYMCVCILWKGHWVEYSVPCPSKSPLPWLTTIYIHTSLHTCSGDVPHTHTYVHTHTHTLCWAPTHIICTTYVRTHMVNASRHAYTASQTTKYDTIREGIHVSLRVWLFAYVVHSHLPTTALAKRTVSDSCSVTCKPPWVDTALHWE